MVLGYLRGRGFPDPEDVCGEVFLEVVRDLHRFEGDERAFRSWVLTIAHHRGLDAARHRSRRPVDAADDRTLHAAAPAVPAAETTALTGLLTAETVGALDTLADDQREVLLLRLLGGLTASEIAEVTGRSREAVKSLQRRGIDRLRAHLGARLADADRGLRAAATPRADGER